ncbi:MAG: MBOAT family protein [Bacteroidales bacterium]|nr:MBOAT family protein [Bacteroidales bacterium]
MLFNSVIFIFAFFPLTVITYFILLRKQWVDVAHWFLIGASFVVYGWVNPYYSVILLSSIIFNYLIAKAITTNYKHCSRNILILGICVNVSGLIVFKYYNFLINNINPIFNIQLPLLHLGLGLGISFITFMQIAYIVQVYQGIITDFNFKEYALFASFFPKLINGPIAYYEETIPQFTSPTSLKPNYDNMAKGSYIFFIGLFKKLVVADTLALVANSGFDASTTLTVIEAWLTSLAYTFQIYFDFSGYIDMAIGIALFFNILLPINFNSPYKAMNIRDFWKRWHITLTRFLTTYIYIPLGGNRNGEASTLRNIIITFVISGFWHGAGWTFVFWGFL